MITKNDCMSILIRLEDRGININDPMKKLIIAKEPPIDVLKFIAAHQGIEAINFYDSLRQKHNKYKSPVYTNIMNIPENINDVCTTLASLLTQCILFGKKLNEAEQASFYKMVRTDEITRALNTYFTQGVGEDCIKLLNLIKIDLLVLEYINGQRNLESGENKT